MKALEEVLVDRFRRADEQGLERAALEPGTGPERPIGGIAEVQHERDELAVRDMQDGARQVLL